MIIYNNKILHSYNQYWRMEEDYTLNVKIYKSKIALSKARLPIKEEDFIMKDKVMVVSQLLNLNLRIC